MFGTDEIGKKNCDFVKKIQQFWKKIVQFFSKVGKVYLLYWDFSANWECSRSFFSTIWEKIWYGNRTKFCIEKKP